MNTSWRSLKIMTRVSYNISGFDCAQCANKAMSHLSKDSNISSLHYDFNRDTLHIVYNNNPYDIDRLKAVIKEVESDDIEITILGEKTSKKSFFDKEMIILSIRIVISIIIMVLSLTLFNNDSYFWLNFGLYLGTLLLIGYDIFYKVILHIVHVENPLDEYLLMSLASIGAFLIASITRSGDFFDSLMVLTLFQIGEVIEGVATNKSKDAIKGALSLKVETAHKVVGDKIEVIDPKDIEVGDTLIVTSGELFPVDGEILEGEGFIDTSSLTGEFLPISVKKNKKIFSGFLLKEGRVKILASKRYEDSAVAKINELVSNSESKKSKADNFVSKFARWYTPIIFVIAILVALIGGLVSKEYSYWAILGLKMLVVACPCAIVISVPLAYFSALGLASKHGIIVKGSNYLDLLGEIDTLVTDKTGTLTKGEFEISKIYSVNNNDDELLEALYASEYLSHHPLGKAVVKDIDINKYSKDTSNFVEISGYGVSVIYKGATIYSGSIKLLEKHHIKDIIKCDEVGSVIYASKGDRYLGYVLLRDTLREDTKLMVDSLRKRDIDVMLLSGDKIDNVKAFSNELGISRYQGELLPDDKIKVLEEELDNKHVVAYLGDGINDAASIKEADIGIAMGAIGSDIAVTSADVVIMTDHPSKVVTGIKIAKIARHTSIFNIVFALFIKIGIEVAALITSILGIGNVIPMWAAVIADTGLTVLLVINSLLVLYRKVK